MIKHLGEMGKVVTHTQFKNKWDHLRKRWKDYNKCFECETRLGLDPGIGQVNASDEWWTRKIVVSSFYIIVKTSTIYNYILLFSNYWLSTYRHAPRQEPLKKKVCQIKTPWTSCLEAQLQRRKMHFARVVKYQRKALKGLRTPLITKNLLTPNVNPL